MTMASQKLKTCILHKDPNDTSGQLIPINENTWDRILMSANKRKSDKINPAWLKVINELPSDQPTDGFFHMRCYKSFTSVPNDKILKV